MYWLPWPGKTNPSFPDAFPCPKNIGGLAGCSPLTAPFAWVIRSKTSSWSESKIKSLTSCFDEKAFLDCAACQAMAWLKADLSLLSYVCMASEMLLSFLIISFLLFPESVRICTVPSQEILVFSGVYSSSTAWKFDPPNPKAETPEHLKEFIAPPPIHGLEVWLR